MSALSCVRGGHHVLLLAGVKMHSGRSIDFSPAFAKMDGGAVLILLEIPAVVRAGPRRPVALFGLI